MTFWNRKIVLVSTPTNKGTSRIEAAFEESDQRRFWVPCPDCGAEQVLTWTQVRWSKGPGGDHRPQTARYHCAECDAAWRDESRWAAVSRGHWVAEQPFAGVAGFHLNEIYSPWVRLEAMVRAFLSARSGGDETMKTFVNTSLGETWVETGEAPDWQRLYDRRENWKLGTVPSGGLFLTAGADVQKDRIEVDVWAWGRGLESWLVDHVVIEGGPDRHDAWSELTALLDRSLPHERGAHLRIARLAIDTGYEAPAVYSWSRNAGFAQVSPVKGVDWGLRRMMLHYAHLCAVAGGVDAFLIGSEMRGLTTIRSGASTYPAVTAFKALAADVRAILGAGTEIGYAADWSEYFGHHPGDGSGDVYFHLDPLWSDANIDFVGIDNYMPLSDWRDGFGHADAAEGWPAIYDRAYLKANIAGREGFDWFYASAADRSAQVRTPITDGASGKPWVFRYKDLRSWWSNPHFNRPGGVESGTPTSWVPESKPIRFTELGCPAIDRGTNQPNVFFDPKSSESFKHA